MSDLFTRQPDAPLAERLRPHTLDDVIGQQHLIGEGKPLRVAVEGGKPHSMLLWGPPGVGKTTLARILAQSFNAQFLPVSAVFSGVKDIREAIDKAEIALQQGRATILFVDEVHRFNKAQQDAFLPHVESGLLTFIGATTENPSFEVNPALLSRAQVYVLQSLSSDDLKKLIVKVLALPEYRDFTIEADAQELLVNTADGDARRLLNLLEQLLRAADTRRLKTLTAEFLADSLGAQIRRFDKGGESFYNQISALHKSVRGSHPNAALYWFCRMLDGGTDPRYLARRQTFRQRKSQSRPSRTRRQRRAPYPACPDRIRAEKRFMVGYLQSMAQTHFRRQYRSRNRACCRSGRKTHFKRQQPQRQFRQPPRKQPPPKPAP